MRIAVSSLLPALALTACGQETEQRQAPAPAAAAEIPVPPTAAQAQSAPLMEMPEDPEALERLRALGYTIHEDHLHAPGVNSCPMTGESPVM